MQRLASKHQLGGYGSGHPCREVVSGLTFKAQRKAIVDPLTTRIANALTDLSIGELWGVVWMLLAPMLTHVFG